jgi:hypothetical protein
MHILTPARRPDAPALASAGQYRAVRFLGLLVLLVALLPLSFVAIAFAPLWLERGEEGWKCR